ncbi:MAG: SGNH/GDSL hydrolase family protein [Verrucomicrobiota bacterium JB023]|nr:SGNH/GDSL hydrolase family protein [Verrucomicrobiota bacterium JB023]
MAQPKQFPLPALLLVCLLMISLLATSPAQAAEKAKVLIIGDSISIGYTPHVRKALSERAEVKHHKGNAQHTGTGLEKLDDWLGEEEWDVIHFNWGLWDLCYRHPDSKVQGKRDKVNGTLTTPLEQYGENLDTLVSRLKETGAELIWASTTVVPTGEAGRKVDDDLRYNAMAANVMSKHGIAINDLNAVSRTFPEGLFVKPGDVHYTKEGYRKLGAVVAEAITRKLVSEQDEATKSED